MNFILRVHLKSKVKVNLPQPKMCCMAKNFLHVKFNLSAAVDANYDRNI